MLKIIKNRKGKEFEVLIDDEDEDLYDKHTWHKDINGYASTNIRINSKYKKFNFHRMIMDIEDSKVCVDHINHNTLDNRRSNLRLVTCHQNAMNRKSHKNTLSIFKGISFRKDCKKWQARIMYNYKLIHLGLFESEIEAAKAYDQKAKELFGEFAFLNFPEK